MLKLCTMSSRRLAAMYALCVCACGGGAAPTEQPASAGGSAAAASQAGAGGGAGSSVLRSGITYEVPVDPSLAAAAVFAITKVDWRASGSEASLSYDLPRELVGKNVSVELTGSVDASGVAHLAGGAGTADCASVGAVVCHEVLSGLKPLQPDLAVVQSLAEASFAGSIQDRLDVARLFAGDPIGILTFDPAADSSAEDPKHP